MAVTRTVTVALPVTSTGRSSGADSKDALCPGMSTVMPAPAEPSRSPKPGTEVTAAGEPPGGVATF